MMIELSTQLIEGLKNERTELFIKATTVHVLEVFEKQKEKHDEALVELFVRESIERGKHKFYLEKEQALLDYVELNARLGFDFESDTFYVLLGEVISQYEGKKNTLNSEYALYLLNVYETEYPSLSNEAYMEHFESLKTREFDMNTLTKENWLFTFKTYVPKASPLLEKELAMARILEISNRVEKYRLLSVKAKVIYQVLALRFGIGLDINPLYQEFKSVLNRFDISEEEKCTKLLQYGIYYLEISLGKIPTTIEVLPIKVGVPDLNTNDICSKTGQWKAYLDEEFRKNGSNLGVIKHFNEGDVMPRLLTLDSISNIFLRWKYVDSQ